MTDAVLDEVAAWQGRPLEPVYPLVFFDGLRIKIRDEGLVCNKAVYVALGVRADGTTEILGLWLEQNEGAKFRLRGRRACPEVVPFYAFHPDVRRLVYTTDEIDKRSLPSENRELARGRNGGDLMATLSADANEEACNGPGALAAQAASTSIAGHDRGRPC